MKTRALIAWIVLLGFVCCAQQALAAKMAFRWKGPNGRVWVIRDLKDLNKYLRDSNGRQKDPRAYAILKNYLTDVQEIKDKIDKTYTDDITVTVNSCTKPACNKGSWTSADGNDVQIQSSDYFRDVSTLAHETGHVYMRKKAGWPPFNYGKDGNHFVNEITDEGTAFMEGYAEWCGSYWGKGQEQVKCAGSGALEKLKYEGPNYQKPGDPVNWYFDYKPKKWKDITSADNMWKCEGINALIMKDFTSYIPTGASKIQEMVRSGYRGSLKDMIKEWIKRYPEDAASIAKIVDVDTNYLMTDQEIKDLTGASDYVTNDRAKAKMENQGKSSCDSLKKIFGTGGGGLPPPAPGGGGGVKLKPFR